MKLDKKISKKLINNLEVWQLKTNSIIKKSINKMKKIPARSEYGVEKIMDIKTEMIINLLTDSFLDADLCYFCLKYIDGSEKSCKNCEYGKSHGICFESSSNYCLLITKLLELRKLICLHYRF